jgi:hypothetical protein
MDIKRNEVIKLQWRDSQLLSIKKKWNKSLVAASEQTIEV